MIFAIAGRRLVELTKLKSYANGKLVKLAFFDDVSEPKEIYRTTKTIGFLSLLNHLIHADDIYFFHNRLEVTQYFRKIDSVALYRILDKVSRENRWSEYSLEPSVFIVTDRSVPIMCCLSDIAITSIEVAEKIIEQCSDSGIFLESEYRGGV